ncbi:MAG: hypothetical protein EOP06_10035 [Proteobacteria bacterium]|nr:MAG: hypothetical protein EOP06_10035 [Pseudomonadota bacterium]
MQIPVGAFMEGGLTEEQFNGVLDRLERVFADDVLKVGDVLKVKRLWNDATVNASAMRMGNTEVINMYGGLARHPAITIEGFALVACHEFGHHHGGAPKSGGWYGNDWASNEGASDYYATLKCLRRFFVEDDNAAIIATANIDPVADATCKAQFVEPNDQLLCLRTSMAGQSVADLFFAMKKETTPPRYSTPDTSVVTETDDDHPATQCRLDTMLAGFACNVPATEGLSNEDYKVGTCHGPVGTVGARPLCWFAPN